MTTDLSIAAHSTEKGLVVRLSGVLAGADTRLSTAVSAVPRPRLVVFDMTGVRVLTAAGARALAEVVSELADRGVRCRGAVEAHSPVATVLATAKPPSFPVLGTVVEALTPAAPAPMPGITAGVDLAVLAAELASLTSTLVGPTTVDTVLNRVVLAAEAIMPGAPVASVTLRARSGGFFTPIQTDPLAGALDEVQYRTGAGPCVDAAQLDGPGYAVSPDLATETRWPRFAEAAADSGFASVLSTGMRSARPAAAGAALNIYTHLAGGPSERDRHAALLLANHAALALAHAESEMKNRQLRTAIETRDVIGQAKGILMATKGMSADEAFEVLRQTSQDLNLKLVDLARTLAAHPDGLSLR